MTKREFERWKRLCYERSDINLVGYVYIHNDCPLLTEKEKSEKWMWLKSLDFRALGKDLIQGDFILIKDRHFHRKWVKYIRMYDIYGWQDISGKRESKLRWVLKNINS